MGGSLSNLKRVDQEVVASAVTKRPPPKRPRSFGELDFEFDPILGGGGPTDEALPIVTATATTAAPPSSAPVTKKKPPVGTNANANAIRKAGKPSIQTRATRQGMEAVTRLAEEETRIAKAGVLESIIDQSRRPTMALDEETAAALLDIGDTNNNNINNVATKIASSDPRAALKSLDSLDAPDAFDSLDDLNELNDWGDLGASRPRDAVPSSHPSGSGVASSRGERVAEMRELYARGEAAAALNVAAEIAQDLTASEPEPFDENDPYGGLIPVEEGYEGFGGLESAYDDAIDATAIVDASNTSTGADSSRLRKMTSRHAPRLLISPKEMSKLPMDPRAAFLLGNIDGVQSMEEILDICAMPEAEALELIEWLQRMGVIAID